jgi:hypothetical protein
MNGISDLHDITFAPLSFEDVVFVFSEDAATR